MAFEIAKANLDAFRPVDLAGMYAEEQRRRANEITLRNAEQKIAAREKWNELTGAPGADLRNPELLRQLMAVDPAQASELIKAQDAREKFRREMLTQNQEAVTGMAGKLFDAFGSLPQAERTDERLRQVVRDFRTAIGPHHPEMADIIDPDHPDVVRSIITIGRTQGKKFPEEQQAEEQRKAAMELYGKQAFEQFKTGLPMSAATQQELEYKAGLEAPKREAERNQNIAQAESGLRKESYDVLKPAYASLDQIKRATAQIKNAKENPVAAFAAIQQVQKLIDEMGVVRTEDIQSIQKSQDVSNALERMWRSTEGGTLTDAMAKNLQDVANTYEQIAKDAVKQKTESYVDIAKHQGVSPEYGVYGYNFAQPAPAPAAPPTAGNPVRRMGVNRQTGEQVIFELRNGQWERVQ